MNYKSHNLQYPDKNRWARFTLTITAALVLTLIIIFVPVTAGTAIQVNVPISPHGTAIDVVLPFGTTSKPVLI